MKNVNITEKMENLKGKLRNANNFMMEKIPSIY